MCSSDLTLAKGKKLPEVIRNAKRRRNPGRPASFAPAPFAGFYNEAFFSSQATAWYKAADRMQRIAMLIITRSSLNTWLP